MNTKEQHRQDWQARIAAYRTSGLTMKAWCYVTLTPNAGCVRSRS
ncbi:IS66 family insertion sequence element accessory protein TnpA [Paenibacillus sp. sptzw28]